MIRIARIFVHNSSCDNKTSDKREKLFVVIRHYGLAYIFYDKGLIEYVAPFSPGTGLRGEICGQHCSFTNYVIDFCNVASSETFGGKHVY